ncbi:hypothetical protein TcG_00230 [Trypanosoma cruzi]|nr:hypothetical protein TcG_00230 [Trypanosoma cruzi]
MTSGPAQAGNRHPCTGVAARHGFLNAALVVGPWAASPTRRAVDTFGGNELARRATVLWAKLAPGGGRHTTIFSEGHSIARRAHSRRVALRKEGEEVCLPRRGVDVCTFTP